MFGFLLAVMPGDGSDCWVADCIEDETGEVDTERARSISAPFALLEADAALEIAAMAEETQNPNRFGTRITERKAPCTKPASLARPSRRERFHTARE
jgi:hypothetical protein